MEGHPKQGNCLSKSTAVGKGLVCSGKTEESKATIRLLEEKQGQMAKGLEYQDEELGLHFCR